MIAKPGTYLDFKDQEGRDADAEKWPSFETPSTNDPNDLASQSDARSLVYARRVLRWPEVYRVTARSRTQVWRYVKAGKFPAPVQLGENAVGWYEDEIAAWLESRPRASYAK